MAHPLSLAFVWHMHQPCYQDDATGLASLPWVRLHATKDYLDMVLRLEPFPTIHQTFNLVPALLDQLEAYLPPTSASDVFLDHARAPAAELTEAQRRFLLQWFFLANLERMIAPQPRYHDLLAKRGAVLEGQDWGALARRFSTQDYLDLQVWFTLAWMDPWLRRQEPRLAALERQGTHFTEEDKREVLARHLAWIARVVPAYREAAAQGRVELSTSPYYHPVLPLLCNVRQARAALPTLPLPEAGFAHPEDARWQLQQALSRHEAVFGTKPAGLWPPEGGVSEDVATLACEAGFRWIATDEAILWRTLEGRRPRRALYRPYRIERAGRRLAVLFRDRELSDRIGFVYSRWEASRAVEDFMGRLLELHHAVAEESLPALVSVILDGENAWETYPDDGHEFLLRLYEALAAESRIRCVTVSEFLATYPLERAASLPTLASGSWIDGNFATWAGHPEKNAAWTLLAQAREALAAVESPDRAHPAWRSLGAAEGSDWFWWFGNTHFSLHADEFDRLFRLHLSNAYRLAGLEPPETLSHPLRAPQPPQLTSPTGPMRPMIDGRETTYYEWLYAGRIVLRQQESAMHRGESYLQALCYGLDQTHHYVRLDPNWPLWRRLAPWQLDVTLADRVVIRLRPRVWPVAERATEESLSVNVEVTPPSPEPVSCAFGRIVEVAIPTLALGLREGRGALELTVQLEEAGKIVEQHPAQGASFALLSSLEELDPHHWPA